MRSADLSPFSSVRGPDLVEVDTTAAASVVRTAGAASADAARLHAEQMARWSRRVAASLQSRTGITGAGAAVLALALVAWILGRVIAGRGLYLLAYSAAALVLLLRVLFNRPPALVATR